VRKRNYQIGVIILCSVISILLSIWYNYIPIAIIIGFLGVWFGIQLIKIAKIDLKIISLLALQVFLISMAFTLLYFELTDNFLVSLTISFQNLFHVNLITLPISLENSFLYKICTLFETFVGFILIISGVGVTIKTIKVNDKMNV
jgi:hypothetical protein